MSMESMKMTAPDNLFTAETIKNKFTSYTAGLGTNPMFASDRQGAQNEAMSDIHREEVKARLEASEARVAAVVEAMRADAAELRAELREGNAHIKAQGEIANANAERFQADADKFYADARALLAESRTALTEIRLTGEQNKTAVMGLGYKVATWAFGAIVAAGGLYFTIKKAVTPTPAPSPAVAPATSPPAQPGPSAPAQAPPPAAKP